MKRIALVIALAVCAVSFVSTTALAKGGKKKQQAGGAVAGTLAVTANADGKATAITITDKSGKVYNVDMTGFTQDVTALNGKPVKAKGEVKEVDGKTVLTVLGDISAAPEKKAGKRKNKPAAQ